MTNRNEKVPVAVRYYSRGGHTGMLANAIAEELGCKATSTSNRLRNYTDVLFLGAAIYNGKLDANIIGFIDHLDRNMVGKIILFGSAAVTDPCKKMRQRLEARGIPCETDHFYCKGNYKFIAKNRPNAQDVENARAWARKWNLYDPEHTTEAGNAADVHATVKSWLQR